MKFAYIGTDEFAADVLRQLVAAGRSPSLVVSRPDSKQGRGRKLSPPPVAAAATELGLNLIQPASADDGELLAELERSGSEVLCLCAYGAIIREPILSKWTILNVHPSLLPRWRGAAPIERAIMAGDSETGVSIIKLVEELDAGPVALVEAIGLNPDDDFETLSSRLRAVGARLLVEALTRFESGTLEFAEQADDGATYAERILADDRVLNPSKSAAVLEQTVRALRPHIGARLSMPDGEMVGVRAASVVDAGPTEGEFVLSESGLLLGCSTGALSVTRVIPPGGREMNSPDWLRGRSNLL